MIMMFRMLIFVIALALLPTSLVAGPRFAVSLPTADASGQSVVTAPGTTKAAGIVVSGKRCLQGALPSIACGADIGLPVSIVLATAATVATGFERYPPAMAGVSPGCLVGPPRSC